MSEETRYTIEVRDDAVEITGTLTIREAFDFLAFFEREGYTTLEDWGERTTLYFRKRNIDQELTDRVNKNTLDELEDVKKDYKGLLKTNIEQAQKIKELEGLIKNHMMDESERFKALKKENEKLEKFKILQHQDHFVAPATGEYKIHEETSLQKQIKEAKRMYETLLPNMEDLANPNPSIVDNAFQDKISKVAAELRGKEIQILDDFCKAYYAAESHMTGRDLMGIIGRVSLKIQTFFKDGQMGTKYWFSPKDTE